MVTFKYRAFISYSHKDKKWGNWLHKGLERYRIPKNLIGQETRLGAVPDKIFPVFRDREELPTSSDLSTAIREALENSQSLIVICSRNSAQSKWVNEEILAFKRIHGEDNILAIIVDGEPNATDKPGLEDQECFPPALRFKMGKSRKLTKQPTEPIAADAREAGDGKDDAPLKLIAGVLGVNFNDLKKREVQEAKRRARRSQMVAACMGVLAVLALGAGWFAWGQRNDAKLSHSQLLARESRAAVSEGDPTLGALLALGGLPSDQNEWFPRPDSIAARIALQHALDSIRLKVAADDVVSTNFIEASQYSGVVTDKHGRVFSVFDDKNKPLMILKTDTRIGSISPDGGYAVLYTKEENASIIDVSGEKPPIVLNDSKKDFAFSDSFRAHGKSILTVQVDGRVRIWERYSGKLLLEVRSTIPIEMDESADHRVLAVKTDTNKIALIDTVKGELIREIEEINAHGNFRHLSTGKHLRTFHLSKSGNLIGTSTFDGIYVWPVYGSRAGVMVVSESYSSGSDFLNAEYEFSPNDTLLAVGYGNGNLIVYDISQNRAVFHNIALRENQIQITAIDFDETGKFVAWGDERGNIWNAQISPRKVAKVNYQHNGRVTELVVKSGMLQIISAAADNAIKFVTEINGVKTPHTLLGLPTSIMQIKFDQARNLILGQSANEVMGWSISDDPRRSFIGSGEELSVSGDGRRFAILNEGNISVFNSSNPFRPLKIISSQPSVKIEEAKEIHVLSDRIFFTTTSGELFKYQFEDDRTTKVTNGNFGFSSRLALVDIDHGEEKALMRTTNYPNDENSRLLVINLNSGELEFELKDSNKTPFTGSFLGGQTLIAGQSMKDAQLWDFNTGEKLEWLINGELPEPTSQFRSDLPLVGFEPLILTLYDQQSGKVVGEIKNSANSSFAADIFSGSTAFNSSGDLIFVGTHGNKVQVWEWNAGILIYTLKSPLKFIHQLVTSVSTDTLLGLSLDGRIAIWSLSDRVLVDFYQLPGKIIQNVQLLEGGKKFITRTDKDEIHIWDMPDIRLKQLKKVAANKVKRALTLVEKCRFAIVSDDRCSKIR